MMAPRTSLVSRRMVMAAPASGTMLQANSYNTSLLQPTLLGFYSHLQVADTVSATWTRQSSDNGATWSQGEPWPTVLCDAGITHRRHYRSGYLDPLSGRFLLFRNEARMRQDEIMEWYTLGTLHYSVSPDGGLTYPIDEQVLPGHIEPTSHPVTSRPGTMMLGDWTCLPITLADGSILLAPAVSPLDENGAVVNPGGGYTYHDTAVIRGTWRPDGGLEWQQLATLKGDPARTTRGLDEATLGLLHGGRILMVMRGSNDVAQTLPGYRWYAISSDGGHTWTEAAPWTYETGAPFFSPASCSQLLQHSGGGLFWLGNICPENPCANLPRQPFQIVEVDRDTGLLIESSKMVIDDRGPGDAPSSMFSNFSAREDLITGEIVLSMSRICTREKPGRTFALRTWSPDDLDFTSDAYEYRIRVHPLSL